MVLADPERAMFAGVNRAGRALYPVASEFVLDCYYRRGALEPLVKAYSGQPYRVAARFDRLLRHLVQAQRDDLIERFWTSLVRLTRAEFLYQRPRRDHGDETGAAEFKQYALDAYAQGIGWMVRLGRTGTAERLAAERDALRDERFPPLPAPSDPRRIDARVFWEVIGQTRSSTTVEQLAALDDALRAFKAADIKRFASLYAALMRRLFHWNVWAIAYAARGGCSDDAFDGFRTWLILQGDPDLVAVTISDALQAAARVPRDPDLPEGHCLSLIQDAYFARAASPLRLPAIDLVRPRGREWTESAFPTTFPELVQHYASTHV
jgi:hypothetical protein